MGVQYKYEPGFKKVLVVGESIVSAGLCECGYKGGFRISDAQFVECNSNVKLEQGQLIICEYINGCYDAETTENWRLVE